MIVLLGRLSLAVALLGAGVTVIAGWSAARRPSSQPSVWLRRGPRVVLGGAITAFALLEVALLTNDFSVAFVVAHHRRATSGFFTVTSAWAGLEGSLLLWATVIAVYLAVVGHGVGRGIARGDRRPAHHVDSPPSTDRLGAGAVAVVGVIAGFFIGLVLFVAPTFTAAGRSVADGVGANPLLQDNVLMAIHPPLLYLGYVGFMVPFAFAVSALALRERGPAWVLRTQRWALVAWSFLTAGIIIGGWWSYDVLGWGGYWAWDPVENASFLPWLVGTAYLHSAIMQARRGMLPAWSVGLVMSSFIFTLLGTFLARSGVIASVHAFSGSSLGPVLLVFLIVVVVIVVWLFFTRLGDVVTGPRLQSLFSREGMILVNNLLLALFAVVVLVGTACPIVLEAIRGDRVSVGRPFFDVWAVWISLALLTAMCVGIVAPYKRASARSLWSGQRLSAQIGLAFAAVLVANGLRAPYVIVVAALTGTIVATAIRQLARAVGARTDHRGRSVALGAALRSRPSFWAGHVAHIGLAIVALGIASSSNLAQRATITLQPGTTTSAAGMQLTYVRPTARRTTSFTSQGVLIRVERGSESSLLMPEFHQYPNQREPIAVPAVWTTGRGDDAYLALYQLDATSTTLRVTRYPWLVLIWIGGLTMAAGGVLGLGLQTLRRRADAKVDDDSAKGADEFTDDMGQPSDVEALT